MTIKRIQRRARRQFLLMIDSELVDMVHYYPDVIQFNSVISLYSVKIKKFPMRSSVVDIYCASRDALKYCLKCIEKA